MRTFTIAVLAMVAWGLTTDVSAGVGVPPGFVSSFEKALAQAKKDNKPLYVHFTTDWCGWCRRIEKDVYADAKGKEALSAFVAVSLDCSDNAPGAKGNKTLFSKYGGTGYPFLVIIAPDGAVLKSWSGYVQVDGFVKRLADVQKTFDRYSEFQEKAKTADANDIDFQLEAVDVYLTTKQWAKMDLAAKAVIKLDTDRAHLGPVKLAQMQAGMAQKNAATITRLATEIRKLDPENGGNHLEDALKIQADALMAQANRNTLQAQYKKAHAILTERAALANLREPMLAKVEIAMLQANCGKLKDARETLEKTLADDPENPNASDVKDLINRIKQAEAQQKK